MIHLKTNYTQRKRLKNKRPQIHLAALFWGETAGVEGPGRTAPWLIHTHRQKRLTSPHRRRKHITTTIGVKSLDTMQYKQELGRKCFFSSNVVVEREQK